MGQQHRISRYPHSDSDRFSSQVLPDAHVDQHAEFDKEVPGFSEFRLTSES